MSAIGGARLLCDAGAAEIMHVRHADGELIQRVYFAVRNPEWHVLPIVWTRMSSTGGQAWSIEWAGQLEWHDISLELNVTAAGDSGGLTFAVTATSNTSFDYARLGIFVILPVRALQGRAVSGRSGNATWNSHFPVTAGPQRLQNGRPLALFPPHRDLEVALEYGILRLAFDGDDFEVEDERNWTEMGFKVYAGPFSRGWPLRFEQGAKVRQSLRVTYEPAPRIGRPPKRGTADVVVEMRRCASLPRIGHKMANLGRPMDPAELAVIRELAPEFLVADFRAGASYENSSFRRAIEASAQLRCRLSVNLYVEGDPVAAAIRLRQELGEAGLEPLAIFLYDAAAPPEDTEPVGTPARLRDLGSSALHSQFPFTRIFVGSWHNLAEVNRTPPFRGEADGFCIGMSPSGHNDDTWAIFENLPAQGDALRTLIAHDPTSQTAANPVTLQIQAGGGPRPPDRHPWPLSVDARQCREEAASWTLGSLSELVRAGADMAVYYETVGWRGLMERVDGPLQGYPTTPGEPFPVLRVFRDVAELRSWRLHRNLRSDMRAACLCFSRGGRMTILLANLTPTPITVSVAADSEERHRHLLEVSLRPYEYSRRDLVLSGEGTT